MVGTGSNGTAKMNYIEQRLVFQNGAGPTVGQSWKEERLAFEIQHFPSCVRTDALPLLSGQEGLQTLQVSLQAERKTVHAQRS